MLTDAQVDLFTTQGFLDIENVLDEETVLRPLMAESNDRVRQISKLVAQFERAKLILQWERRLSSMPHSKSRLSACMRFLSGFPSGRGKQTATKIFPKWLHVLMPADHGRYPQPTLH